MWNWLDIARSISAAWGGKWIWNWVDSTIRIERLCRQRKSRSSFKGGLPEKWIRNWDSFGIDVKLTFTEWSHTQIATRDSVGKVNLKTRLILNLRWNCLSRSIDSQTHDEARGKWESDHETQTNFSPSQNSLVKVTGFYSKSRTGFSPKPLLCSLLLLLLYQKLFFFS